jgi:hypothetical protein
VNFEEYFRDSISKLLEFSVVLGFGWNVYGQELKFLPPE